MNQQNNPKPSDSSPENIFDKMRSKLTEFQQTLAVFLYFSLFTFCILTFFGSFINPFLWPILIAYAWYIYFDETPENGSRPTSWFRNLKLWSYFAGYFQTRLIKEVDLDPKRNYVFGYHPHGVAAMGTFINFSTNVNSVDQLFPGLNIRVLTLKSILCAPFIRELALYLGSAAVTKKSINNILSMGEGHSCMIVVGGVQESLVSSPDSLKLVLDKRVGFVKLAIKNGADLVPVFGFGDNQLFYQLDNSEGTIARKIQDFLKLFTRLVPPFFYGTGLFISRIGFMPFRAPITTIVGKPIKVEKCAEPTEEMILDYHNQYKTALLALYNENKFKYWGNGNPPDIEFI